MGPSAARWRRCRGAGGVARERYRRSRKKEVGSRRQKAARRRQEVGSAHLQTSAPPSETLAERSDLAAWMRIGVCSRSVASPEDESST